MRKPTLRDDPAAAWAPYQAGRDTPWDIDAVAHLHRRAGFSPGWEVLNRDLDEGPEPSINRLLEGEPVRLDGRPATEFEEQEDRFATRFGGADNNLRRLQAVWLLRMIRTPHPLQERLTLFWHDHFATSNAKVNSTNLMRRQNALMRKHALGSFPAMLREIAQDPAMLLFLDSATNRKAHPNENYAREVMELFTLGRGHYSERDIQEAARAFSGSFIQGESFRMMSAQHDPGTKTILGREGAFGPDDVADVLLEQPACAEYLCGKLYAYLVDEVEMPRPALIAPLAEAFRGSGYQTRVPVEMILRSRLFFDGSVRRRRVKSPVELAVGTARALEILSPTVPGEALAESVERMGQSLFAPPGVAGWDWGAAWFNTQTAIERTNFLLAIAGLNGDLGNRLDPAALATKHRAADEPARFFANLLLQDAMKPEAVSSIKGGPTEALVSVLNAPEYQLA